MNCNDNNFMTRILVCGHEHVLHRDVDPKDFKCPTRVKATLPCGHETTQKPCHIDIKQWKCGFPCNARIDQCAHSCIRTCHVNHDPDHIEYKCYKTCDRVFPDCSTETHRCQMFCHQICAPCQVIVAKKLPNCNHIQDLECSASGDNVVCMEPCSKKITKCGHDCKRICQEPCGGCEEMVIAPVSSCGHKVRTICSKPADIQNCCGPCTKRLPCGHRCKNKCNEICTELCWELVNDLKPTFCGHRFEITCYLQKQQLPIYSNTLLQFCKEPCSAVLECSHQCSGTCGECFQGRIHVTCMENCEVPLICGHECKIPCREVCQPCQLPCPMKCSHNECTKTCGEQCTECQESCPRRCIHADCTAKCGEICTVSPCEEPCEKKLPCSHPCVGYCGDSCPPLCRICNADELTELFLGYEDEIDARFVLLDECKHVIESQGMKSFCKQDQTFGIQYMRCPRCRTQLTSTLRYSDYIKRAINEVAAVKRKSCGSFAEIEEKRKELQEQLNKVKLIKQNRMFVDFQDFDNFVDECGILLQPINKNKRQIFDLMIGGTLEAKLTIVQNIGNILQIINVSNENEVFLEAKSFVQLCLSEGLFLQAKRITNQEIRDFERELNRLQRIAQFVRIAQISQSNAHKEMRELIYQPVIYTENYDKIVKGHLEEFQKKMNIAGGLNDQKRLEIVRAMGLKKGSWYKCPNGHIYAIGECGKTLKRTPMGRYPMYPKYMSYDNCVVDCCCTKMNCNDNNCITRILDCGHEHVMHRDVDPKYFKCPTRVKATLPCGHKTTQKHCHIDVKEWNCSFPCNARIEQCGHSCIRTCHVNHDPDHIEYKCYKTCDRVFPDCSTETHRCQMFCHQICAPCQVIVAKKLPNCNHIQDLECSASGDNVVCMEPCSKKITECGHDCKRRCHEPCDGCEEMVIAPVSLCGHKVRTICSKPADIQNCCGPCTKRLPCGHRCKNKCNEICTELCWELVNQLEPTFCGHRFEIPCYLQKQQLPIYSNTLLQFCKQPCSAVLECSHQCSGTCGECFQERIHVTCMEKCGVPLICGHECNIPCREVCQPCQLPCPMKCSHNECTKTCGAECTKCQESCPRRCIHAECTAKCGEICTVSPCEEPCEKKLPCSHPCVGFCGDPCPPLCRICNAGELTEVFLGYEDEIDARFVLLSDCKHVIESKGMEIYCEQLDEGGHKGIKYSSCPKCRTPITSIQRYSDYVKQAVKDVAAIKRKSNGSDKEIQTKREELQEKLNAIKVLQHAKVFLTSEGIDEFVIKCETLLQPVRGNRRQMFDLMIAKTLEAKLMIVQDIANVLKAQQLNVRVRRRSKSVSFASNVFSEASTYLDFLFKRLTQQIERITNQEIQDFKREQNRLQRIAQFIKIAESSPSGDHREMRELIYQPIIFTGDYDKKVKAKLASNNRLLDTNSHAAPGEMDGSQQNPRHRRLQLAAHQLGAANSAPANWEQSMLNAWSTRHRIVWRSASGQLGPDQV